MVKNVDQLFKQSSHTRVCFVSSSVEVGGVRFALKLSFIFIAGKFSSSIT